MSLNQSRAERSDGQLRRGGGRSGGSSGQHRGFSGGGGGKGGGNAPPTSSVPLPLSTNRSFKKSGNGGQVGQPRANPPVVNPDAGVPASAANSPPARAVQNGAHAQPPLHAGPSSTQMPSGPKPVDMPNPRNSRALPKAPTSQPAAGASETAAPVTPASKGDGAKAFTLQFGSISPGIMNGMQIPARTSSAPPNLDEQKRDQARHDPFRAVPTLPMPNAPKQQQPPPRKDVGGMNQLGDSHSSAQIKRDVHAQISAAPTAPPPKSAAVHMAGMSMPMPFQQTQIPMQFGGPNVQLQSQGVTAGSLQMPMTLPIGNPPQVPQQMFVHNIQSHPLQPQMMHQGQGLSFAPQMGHQLAPQLGNMGIGIAPSQFAQQPPRKTTVKITHPETHEELRLDKRTDSSSSGQRPLPNTTPQSQPMPAFTHSHYYPHLQPGSYNTTPIFFHNPTSLPITSAQMTTGSQAPRHSYPVGQNAQAISFMNPSVLNAVSSSKSVPPMEALPGPSVQGKPALVAKVGSPSVTISMPASKVEAPKIVKLSEEASVSHQQKECEVSAERSFQHSIPVPEASSSTTMAISDGHSAPVPSLVSVQRTQSGASSAPSSPAGDSGSVVAGNDGRRKESFRRSDSLKDHHKKPSKKDPRSSLQQQQTDVSDSGDVAKLPTVKVSSMEDAKTRQLSGKPENIQVSSGADIPLSTSSLPSPSVEESSNAERLDGNMVLPGSDSSGAVLNKEALQNLPVGCSDAPELAVGVIPIKEKDPFDTFTSAPETDGIASKSTGSIEQTCSEVAPKEEASGISTLDANNAKVHPVPTITETSESEKPFESVQQKQNVATNLEKPIVSNSQESEKEQFVSYEEAGTSVLDVEKTAEVSNEPVTTSLDSSDAEAVPSRHLTPANIDVNKPSSTDIATGKSETLCSQDVEVGNNALLHVDTDAVPAPVKYEITNKLESRTTESPREVVAPPMPLAPKDKPSSELTRAKPTTGKKKKRRDILSKADAAGTSDLYNAYKGPEEKHQTVSASESGESSVTADAKNVNADDLDKDVVASEEDGVSKAELDDWEDAADVSTPKLRTSESGKHVNDVNKHQDDDGNEALGKKKYTRDFLLTFSEQCTVLPLGFEIGSDIADALMSGPVGTSHVIDREPSYPSPGRISDRSPGASRGDRHDDKWLKAQGSFVPGRDLREVGHGVSFRPGQVVNHGVLRNPRGQSNQFVGGILSGPMQSMAAQGGLARNNSDADRWQRATGLSRGLMPPPQTPMQVMHKAEKKYEVGKVSDKEAAKQRQLKGILNKLTPQNFEKLFEQVKEVNIDNKVTLTGVISQIFDKALMEPTFCEMYANFCFHLAGELPDFTENDEKITFKRLLLNKCQEEFERGEREQAEANKVEEEGEIKQSEEQREEKRVKARRRMLGNIRLIGELYKKRMLTERIMHECIKKLLGQDQNPDEEDIEALCKLMSTIGEMIDHAKAKTHMDTYFNMMLKLSTNEKISSRVRFMLRDAIDLRKNKWQQRRKVEGPKKIEDVHRDAAQERQAQASRLSRGPSMSSQSRRGAPPGDYAPRVSTVLPSPTSQMGSIRGLPTQVRGFGTQDVRFEDKHLIENRTLSVPLPQRPINDDSITLGPQGGLARGMSIRGQPLISNVPLAETPSSIADNRRLVLGPNGYTATPDRALYNSREEISSRFVSDRFSDTSYNQPSPQDRNTYVGNRDSRILDRPFDRSTTAMPAARTQGLPSGNSSAPSDVKQLSEEALLEKSISAIREFYSAKDEEEVALCIKELNSPSFYPAMVSLWVTDSFERKDMERDLLATLLINLCKSRNSLLSRLQLVQGFESVLSSLEDAVNDAPRAAEFLGRIFAKVILENVVPFRDIGKLIHEGGEEPGRLLEIGLASEVIGSVLEIIRVEKGDSILGEIRASSNLRLEDFRPPHPLKSKKLEAFL